MYIYIIEELNYMNIYVTQSIMRSGEKCTSTKIILSSLEYIQTYTAMKLLNDLWGEVYYSKRPMNSRDNCTGNLSLDKCTATKTILGSVGRGVLHEWWKRWRKWGN